MTAHPPPPELVGVDVHLLVRHGPHVLLTTTDGDALELPTGHPRPGESIPAAASRIARVHLGITAEAAHPVAAVHHPNPAAGTLTSWHVAIIIQRDTAPDPPPRCAWCPLADPPSSLTTYSRAALTAYRDGHPFAHYDQTSTDPSRAPAAEGRMTTLPPAPADLPPSAARLGPLAAFATRHLGEPATVTDRSWPRQDLPAFSSVWQIHTPDGRSYHLKHHPNNVLHHAETTAYQQWAAALGPSRTPRLIATDSAQRAILLTTAPGHLVHDAPLAHPERVTVHHQAGQLLRRLHDAAPPRALPHLADTVGAKAETVLRRARGLLSIDFERAIGRLVQQMSSVRLPAVPTHGDYQERNWLWNGHRLVVFDFERADWRWAIHDFERLHAHPWSRHPDLKNAFHRGYGRPLTPEEHTALTALTALRAISALEWGHHQDDSESLQQAELLLTQLHLPSHSTAQPLPWPRWRPSTRSTAGSSTSSTPPSPPSSSTATTDST